jgi:hypothetical protein
MGRASVRSLEKITVNQINDRDRPSPLHPPQHRLHLRDGANQLVEWSTHEELLERGELYINLRKLQVGLR